MTHMDVGNAKAMLEHRWPSMQSCTSYASRHSHIHVHHANEKIVLYKLNSGANAVPETNAVIPAGIAGIQVPWKAIPPKLPASWIPPIPAGMTDWFDEQSL